MAELSYLFALADFKEGMESWIIFITLKQHFFASFKEVDVRRVGLQQLLGVLQVHAADGESVLPVLKGIRKKVKVIRYAFRQKVKIGHSFLKYEFV